MARWSSSQVLVVVLERLMLPSSGLEEPVSLSMIWEAPSKEKATPQRYDATMCHLLSHAPTMLSQLTQPPL